MKPLFKLQGTVEKGNNRGKALGFPTLNFPLASKISEGIYASRTKINNKLHNSLTFIGRAITFDENTFKAETYVLDFDEDLYGQKIEVDILKKMRENKKFASKDDLIKQMKKDERLAREFFSLQNS
ncbi:MAG TPA: riboflavin kinase [Xanthomonadales bacterium]|nr:riboflavin kinase [Xanthomonadales bacterium]